MSAARELSFFVRRLTQRCYNTARPIRHLCTPSTCKDTWPQEKEVRVKIPNQQLGMIPSDHPSLKTKFWACTTQAHLFQLINENYKQMRGREAIRALQSLLAIVKLRNENKEAIISTEEFAMLCEILRKNVRQLSDNDAIWALKLLNQFNVPTSTVIVQMLLQIIRNSVNSLTIEQITFLLFLLPKLAETPLITALRTALPLVLRSHIKSQLDSENVDTLMQVLNQLSGELDDNESVSIVLKHLKNVDKSSIQPSQARFLMKKISQLNYDNNSVEVLKKCQEVLIDSINDIHPHEVGAVIEIITSKCKLSTGIMYNKILLDACAMAIISKDVGFHSAVVTLEHFNHIGHPHKSLLDYITEKLYEKVKKGRSIEFVTLKNLIAGMASANYKPIIWDELEATIENVLLETSSPTVLNTAMNLVSIDCYWPKLLEKIFTAGHCYLDNGMHSRFFLLYNAVKTLYPEYDGPWPSDEILKLCQPIAKLSHETFKSAVECALGGPQYVITDVRTTMGYTIDHVAIMKKNGSPISLSSTVKSIPLVIEELERPEDSQVFLFLHIRQYGCLRNIRGRGGFWYLLIRTLEAATNCKVIPMYYEMGKLSNDEKKDEITRAIVEGMNSIVDESPTIPDT